MILTGPGQHVFSRLILCHPHELFTDCVLPITRTLVNAFQEAGLGVSVATDGVVYETDVLAASNAGPYMYRPSRTGTSSPVSRRTRSAQQQQQQQQQQQSLMSIWGQRPVLVLVGIRLGIDCVNPVYYDTVKVSDRDDLHYHDL